MLYRENGQFKSSYRADQQIFPILQDRIAIGLLLAVAVVAVPLFASQYLLQAIFIPFLILSLAALGLNILVGYCGQVSLGTGAFMAIGAYAAYNFQARIEAMPLIASLLLGAAGARVTHVDASKKSVEAARANQALSGLQDAPIRWRHSSSPTGRSCASGGSPTTHRQARSAWRG